MNIGVLHQIYDFVENSDKFNDFDKFVSCFHNWMFQRKMHIYDVLILLMNGVREIKDLRIENEVMNFNHELIQGPSDVHCLQMNKNGDMSVNGVPTNEKIMVTKKYNFLTDRGTVSIGEGYADTSFNKRVFKIDYKAGKITYKEGDKISSMLVKDGNFVFERKKV
ncbi:hypothetical protein TRFO_09003 [Tritrichomonas foetus]|uniref:Uncharacterized protein n=1 Tax=Tritrichomonas foetus TaxID=1144522 RepID=A0A1J4JLK7_9EUKA|nr:hypothetical protein TRFO_09003 [Tritrichomonas foetus]|eukprot:OHS98156.1 hypothetical protein TRFO_09003 [Tritrichomonas foetus]